MDKQTLWLELYKGCAVNHGIFENYFAPNGDSTEEWIDYIEDPDGISRYELYAFLNGETVKEVHTFKADVSAAPRPYVEEKELTAAEKKQAKGICDLCFSSPAGREIPEVISDAIDAEAAYNGFQLVGQTEDSIRYSSPDGKKKKLKKEYLTQAVHYSHEHLEMLRDEAFVQEFCSCLGLRSWEPIFLILQTINAETYPNIESLEAHYQFNKLRRAIIEEDQSLCQKYKAVLKGTELDISALFKNPIRNKKKKICDWLLDNSRGNPSNLVPVLSDAIRYYPSFAEKLLEEGRCQPMENYSWPVLCPMFTAISNKKYKLVKKMIANGFPLKAENSYDLYDHLKLDEIKELLSYSVTITEKVLERVWKAKRLDILEIIERETDRYITSSSLLAFYVRHGLRDRFSRGLKKGYKCDADTFAACYEHDPDWAEELIQHGFDVNMEKGSPLFKACEKLNTGLFQFLLDHGANLFLKPESYMSLYSSALFACKRHDSPEAIPCQKICYQLLEAGLNPITEALGSSSIIGRLMEFSHSFKMYLVDWLAEHDLLNKPDIENTSPSDQAHVPLYYIRTWDQPIDIELARYMIQKGAAVDASGITGDKLFYWACDAGNLEYIKLLAEAGANLNETLPMGLSGLCAAVSTGNVPVCDCLIHLGADINFLVEYTEFRKKYKEKRYKSVLDIALERNQTECAELLKKAGAKTAAELMK